MIPGLICADCAICLLLALLGDLIRIPHRAGSCI
jgi:hypothetical protein